MIPVIFRIICVLCVLVTSSLSTVAGQQTSAPAKPLVKASPQSVECFFPRDERDQVLCTVRLHLTPLPGHLIRTRAEQSRPSRELAATDAVGNKLAGKFREWELCYDSDANCVIAVYDFKRRPKGGVLKVNGCIDIPVSPELTEHEAIEILTDRKQTITSGGYTFYIRPTDSSANDPDNTVLHIEYEYHDDIADIVIQAEDGTPLQPNIIDGYMSSDNKLVSAVYILNLRAEKFRFVLRTYKRSNNVDVPVKFRATIGR